MNYYLANKSQLLVIIGFFLLPSVLRLDAADRPANVTTAIIKQSPAIPDPAAADYPDCNVAMTAQLENAKVVQIIVPAFRNRIKSPRFNVEDKIVLTLKPYDDIEESIKQFPLVGGDDDFLLERYWGESPQKVGIAENASAKVSTISYKPKFTPYTEEEKAALKLAQKTSQIRDAGNTFSAAQMNKCWKTKKNSFPMMSDFRYGIVGSGVFSLRDRHVFSASPGWSFYTKTLPALFAVNHYLKQHGIRFIVVLVPDPNEIAACALCPELRELKSPILQRELLAFKTAGIETISAWDEFSEAIPGGLLFCYGGDYHLEINGVKILAKKTAEKLKNNVPLELNGVFTVKYENFLHRKWVFPVPCPIRKLNRGEEILAERIYYNGKALTPNEAKDSILLVCGNSFIGYPGFSAFSACLTRELRYMPYHLERQSTGLEKEIPRLLLTKPSILKGRKICIMVLDSTRIANGQWLNIQELDQKLTQLDGAILVAELKAEDFAAPFDSVAIPEWDISTLTKAKQSHQLCYHYFKIQKAGKSRSLDIKLPQRVSKTGKYIAAIPMWSTSLSKLTVADSEETFFSGEEILYVPITSADAVNLKFHSAFSAAIMGIGDIKIYKLKER